METLRLIERIKAVYEGLESLEMTPRRAFNLLAHKLKNDCDENGMPFPMIGDFYLGVRHLVEPSFFDEIPDVFPENGAELNPAQKILLLKWIERKEALIADEAPIYAFAVYMSILARPFIQEYRGDTEAKKGQPVLIYEGDDLDTEEKFDLLEQFHRLYRDAHRETKQMVFGELMHTLDWFDDLPDKEKVEFVEKKPFKELLNFGTPFARNTFDFIDQRTYLEVPDERRFEHAHIMAKSGYGKTHLLENFIFNDIMRAHDEKIGLCVIDGQVDLIKSIKHLKALAPLKDRVIIVDPTDINFPFCLNPFDTTNLYKGTTSDLERKRIYNSTIELLEYVFSSLGSSLTAKQELLFKNAVELLIDMEGATLMTMFDLFEDTAPFADEIEKASPLTRRFFENQFNSSSFKDTKDQVLNRLNIILKTELAPMLTSKTNQLDLYEEMNRGAIILVDTNSSLLGLHGHALMGRFFVAMIMQSAYKRVLIDEDDRTPFFVYVDECHEYVDGNTNRMLSQARKFKVGFTFAHQFFGQLESQFKESLKTNTSFNAYGALDSRDTNSACNEFGIKDDVFKTLRKIDHKGSDYVIKIGDEPAKKVYTPFGLIRNAERMSSSAHQEIVSLNRERYCVDTHSDIEGENKPDTAHGVEDSPNNSPESTTAGNPEQSEKPFVVGDLEDL